MARDYGVKIAKEGFDVQTFLTELNKKNFNILSTEDCLLRKELSATKSTTNMFWGYVINPSVEYTYYGTIISVDISNGGSGYGAYDLVDVVGGDSNAKVYISAVDGSGTATDCFINVGGSGYIEASSVATTGGGGSGFAIDITSISDGDGIVRPLNYGMGIEVHVIYENEMPS